MTERADSRESAKRGFVSVLIATAVVGAAGYVITWLVPRSIGVAPYKAFAVFWAFMFLLTAALSGVQQEITRATHRVSPEKSDHRARNFAIVAGAAVSLAIVASSPLWAATVFGGFALVWPLALGSGSYVFLAVLGGTLYGLAIWRFVFWLILTEGVLRLALIAIALAFTHDVVVLAWMVVLPFPVTAGVIWISSRRCLHGRSALDVGYRPLLWNVTRTISAAAAMGMLVSGFPLLLDLTSHGDSASEIGLLILTATLTRAPLIVVGMALQSYLVVLFRNHGTNPWRMLLVLEGVVVLGGALLTAAGWALGPTIFEWLFPGQPQPSAGLIAALIASSVLVGTLCVTAPAALAQAKHAIFTAGWIVAAIGTILGLLLPLELDQRAIVALVGGPVLGVAIHIVGLLLSPGTKPRSDAAPRSSTIDA